MDLNRRNFLEKTTTLCFKAGLSIIFLGSTSADTFGKSTASPGIKRGGLELLFEPAYLKLHRSGELKQRAERLWAVMESCELCPRACGVNRLEGEKGFCQAPGAELVVSAFHPHFGEEKPLVGDHGSGTVFLTHCNLRCVFCQNWEISQLGKGYEKSIDELAGMMLKLQETGCHNINVVTPTH